MKTWLVAIVALIIGFGLGFAARPAIAPGSVVSATADNAATYPNEAEATAAVRRFKTDPSLATPQATLTLGECGASKISTGVECLVTLVPRPGAAPINKEIGFARIGGQWERTY